MDLCENCYKQVLDFIQGNFQVTTQPTGSATGFLEKYLKKNKDGSFKLGFLKLKINLNAPKDLGIKISNKPKDEEKKRGGD